MAKKTITKEHPLTAFRKANEARNAMVKKSLIKAQDGIVTKTIQGPISKEDADYIDKRYEHNVKQANRFGMGEMPTVRGYSPFPRLEKRSDIERTRSSPTFNTSKDNSPESVKDNSPIGVLKKVGGAVKKPLAKAQVGGTSMTPKKETLAEQNTRIKKEIVAREKRILTKEKKDERNSYSNSRANKVVGKYKKGGAVKIKK